MPPLTSYSETAFAEFLHKEIGGVATRLGWSVEAGSYTDIVSSVELVLGITDVADYANIRQLLALGKREVWRQVVKDLTDKFRFAADFQTFERQQMQAMALKALSIAESECQEAGVGGYEIGIERVDYIHDPYTYFPDDVRVR